MGKSSVNFVATVNAVPITVSDLLLVLNEVQKPPKEDEGGWPSVSIRMFADRGRTDVDAGRQKAWAVSQRLSAMMRLIETGALRHWVTPEGADGAVVVRSTVFVAAAIEPLQYARGGELYFDKKQFTSKVLELAEPHGRG